MAKPSMENPHYTVSIIGKNNIKYDVTNILLSLSLSEKEDEIAQKAKVTIVNILNEGSHLTSQLNVRNRVFVYADTGDGEKEVFRGYVWQKTYRSGTEKELTLICYDNLIYMQESEEYQYFTAGQSTSAIFTALCKKWGIPLAYNHESITHPKLPLRGSLADIFLTDLIDAVRKKTGKRAVIRSNKDTMEVVTVGSNTTIYNFKSKENALSTCSEVYMDGMITKVVLLGKEDDNDRAEVEAVVDGDTATYGTLQRIVNTSTGTTLADAKKEAEELLKEKGKPEKSYTIEAINNPWIRKGDKIYVAAGDIIGYATIKSVEHDATSKLMSMEVRMV